MSSSRDVTIPTGEAVLHGELLVPTAAGAVVLFVHGSGSSRMSPRNREVAEHLREQRMGTLLFDLLTADEERADVDGRYRFDVELLARRLLDAADWLHGEQSLPFGYFGASTGAAAALIAAAEKPDLVGAVVSRGGRPDLAAAVLDRVRAPTLLIVGANDHHVLQLNEEAFRRLRCDKELAVIPGASHLFEEAGTLKKAAGEAARWFVLHLLV